MRSRTILFAIFTMLLAAYVAVPGAAYTAASTPTHTSAATQAAGAMSTQSTTLSATLSATQSATQNGYEIVGFTRFAHTAVDVGPIDIYVGNEKQPLITNLKYGDLTDYYILPATLSGYTARAAGSATDSAPLFSLNWGVKANSNCSGGSEVRITI